MASISNHCFYYLCMLPVILLSLYSLFVHCYCFTDVNFTVLHSFTFVPCLLYLLCHSRLCDVLILTCLVFNCQLTDIECETYICLFVWMYVSRTFFKVAMTGIHMGKIRELHFVRSKFEPDMNSNT